MSSKGDQHDNHSFDLPFGLILGLLGGALAGILFAPKPGKELQEDLQQLVNKLPTDVNTGLSRSKYHYQELVGKTRDSIETEMARRTQKKQANRMAKAKQREELEAGYDY
jgi:gas vesicle protein